jgi:hypothetical protein
LSIRVSLTDFVDFAMKSGVPKITKIAHVKQRPDYSPAADFYKRLREAIVDAHRNSGGKSLIRTVANGQSDRKKKKHYPPVAKAYTSWWGRKNLVWFVPPRKVWKTGSVELRVNPELGLEVNGKPHVIKLYFKPDKLAKNRAEMIAYLMEQQLRRNTGNGVAFSVLDVRRKNLMTLTTPPKRLGALLQGELAALEAMWASV